MARLPLRRYLFLLVAAGILPLAALCGAGLVALFEDQRHDFERRGQAVTRALATAVDAELQRSIAALQVMATSPRLQEGDLRDFREVAQRARSSQPYWQSVSLATPSGERLIDTGVPEGRPLAPIVDTKSLEHVARTISPAVGGLSKGNNGIGIALRVPVESGDRLRYVLTAIVRPEAILEIVRRQRVDESWVISVFDAQGQRVARSRAHEQYLGTTATKSLVDLMSGPAREGAGTTTTLEGDEVLTAYTRLDNGWAVAMGVPSSVASASVVRSMVLYATAVLFSIAVGLLFAGWLARRAMRSMTSLREAAKALGRGELPRVGGSPIAEVQEVSEAIDAAARQRTDYEREREELLAREQAARTEAESANRAKDQFLAMLAHELRNPLAAISNASELLDSPRATAEVSQRAREVIRRQTRHLSRLTDDLLDAARALLGKIPLDRRPVDLAVLASRSLRTLAATGRASGHRIVEHLDEAWVDADSVRLEQVICNLMENAIKYTPPGGTITLRTRREGGESLLAVSDNGIGIAPALLPRVFDLFVQGARGLDRSQGGLGIGLTLVKRLAELHGGRIVAHSAGEGAGSEFTLRLPAVERPEKSMPREFGHAAARSILVIEDNDDARETLRTLLQMLGHRVESARDGAHGLDMALAMAPDIAFVDIGLPDLDGCEIARRLRASGDSVYLVALTGYGTAQDRDRVLDAGFDAHLTKPAELADLEALIAKSALRRAERVAP